MKILKVFLVIITCTMLFVGSGCTDNSVGPYDDDGNNEGPPPGEGQE